MPKEPSSRQFRKGTKSCIECRQRKLRCHPAEDDSQPCQNCKGRGRKCILQTEMGRSSDITAATSRDRISQLEDEVSKLWSVVGHLKAELGHAPSDEPQYRGAKAERHSAETDSEMSEISPMNPPTHLQQLFDNEFLDSHGNDGLSSDMGSEKASSAMLVRARTRLQALMPPKEDVRTIISNAASWLTLYNALFPTMTMFTNAQEMLAKYEALQAPDASPMSIASLLISISITVIQKPRDQSTELTAIKDTAGFVRKVTEAVEETIIGNDILAGTLEGIETSLLYIRLQLVRVEYRKLWLKLRHTIALAELIGLPRAAQRTEIPDAMSPSLADYMRTASRLESAAILWKSICTVDRFIGTMFNLPLGTAGYPFQLPKKIVSDGVVITQSFMAHLANIGCRIQEIDDAYISGLPQTELFEKVFRADQELRSLGNSTPPEWWLLLPGSSLADRLEQYWYYYFTVRTHLQLALRTTTDSQQTYSYLACSQACRAMAVRYVSLRGLLPAAFFAGRVLDLQALTAAIFLLYNSKRPMPQQGLSVQDDGEQPAHVLIERMVDTMDSVANQPSGDFGRQAATAIRAVRSLLEQPRQPADAQNLTLRIPMLGKVNVNRPSQPIQNSQLQQQYNFQAMQPATSSTNFQPEPQGQAQMTTDGYSIPNMDNNELLSWSLDLMLDDIPPFPDNSLGGDQWLSWNSFNAPNGQSQS